MRHKSSIINANNEYSRDLTYIDNLIQMNLLALTTSNVTAVNSVILYDFLGVKNY